MIDRRTILKGMLVGGAAVATSVGRALGHDDDVRRAIRVVLRDRDRWSCAHHLFVAGCLGPWARGRDGRDLLRAVQDLNCCNEEVVLLAEQRIRGAVDAEPLAEPDWPLVDVDDVLRWRHAVHYGLHRCSPPLPAGEDGLEIAIDIVERVPTPWIARAALYAALGILGLAVENEELLFHTLARLKPMKGGHGLRGRVHLKWRDRFRRIGAQHPSGSIRSLVRQALGDLAPSDTWGILALQAAEEAGILDRPPRRGPPAPAQVLEIFRRSVAASDDPSAGAVGVALLRDYPSCPELARRARRPRHIERLSAAARLTLLDVTTYLPRLRAIAYQPVDVLPRSHFVADGAIHAVETWETSFPFDCPGIHHALRHLTHEELRRAVAEGGYECRIEAVIELAHRLSGRPLAALAKSALRSAERHDAVRLLYVVMSRDAGTGRSVGLSLLDHPDWTVTLVAAGAVLNAKS
jgi:hypothetical protein